MNARNVISPLFLLAVMGFLWPSPVLATPPSHPSVDGYLSPDDEYDEGTGGTGDMYQGNYGRLYARYITDQADEWNGFYLCNDWYCPVENFDATSVCDGGVYNRFDFTDTEPDPDVYWRINVLGDGTVKVWTCPNDGQWNWAEQNTSGTDWKCATGYHTSKNPNPQNPAPSHPIWELLIPDECISGRIVVGVKDPVSVDTDDCPCPTCPGEVPGGDGGSAPNCPE
jgi:hypothetical protein